MTYFYKVFRRYTHFAMENITIALDGPNELQFDDSTQLRAKIPRFGDLMSDMYFVFRVPDIYSKYVTPQGAGKRNSQWEFQWVRYLGAAIIQSAGFYVGGQKIQEVDGNYLLSRALMDYDQDKFVKWRWLVGDTDEMTNPGVGSYAGGTGNSGYPTVYPDPSRPAPTPQTNRPSILGRDIYVPLSFWFTESPSQALPLIGLQYHECEVKITLNPVNQLYTILDASGYRVNPEWAMRAPLAQIQRNLPEYASAPDLSGQIRNFFTDIGFTTPPFNSWFLNARLESTFIYLPQEEQQTFASRPLSYCIQQVTPYPFPGIFNRRVLDLYTHNPVTRLILVQHRSDAPNRNDFANFTNWATYPTPPFVQTPGPTPPVPNSGILIPNAQQDILRALRVLCNGNEIQEQKSVNFFTRVSPFRYSTGVGQDGLPIYSFQLHSPGTQPSGSINASRIRDFQVEVDVYDLPVNTTYTYDIIIYVENLNWFEVVSGMGGLKYPL